MSGLLTEGTSPSQPTEEKGLSFPILSSKESKAAVKGNNLKSKPTCARCKNHGMTNYRIGHKGSCVFETCTCELCRATKARNKSMAATMANERRLTAQKRQMSNPGGVVADSSSSVAAQIMCNVKPEYDNLDSEQQTPDTTYDRPVKRQRMSSPSTLSDIITSQTPYTTYLPQGTDTARWQYDCLRQNLDHTRMYNMYNPGMSQFSQQHLPTSCLDDKRILEQYANAGIGKITRSVQPYNMSEILRPSNTTDIMQRHNLIQQGVHQSEDPLMQSNKGL